MYTCTCNYYIYCSSVVTYTMLSLPLPLSPPQSLCQFVRGSLCCLCLFRLAEKRATLSSDPTCRQWQTSLPTSALRTAALRGTLGIPSQAIHVPLSFPPLSLSPPPSLFPHHLYSPTISIPPFPHSPFPVFHSTMLMAIG